MIDPSNLPPNLRAAMDRRPALVPPVSASEFLRATNANPQDARNAPDTDVKCLNCGFKREFHGKGMHCPSGDGSATYRWTVWHQEPSEISGNTSSCPPEPVRVSREQGKPPAGALAIPVKPRRATAMNRTETALFEILKEKFPSCVIHWEKYTLRLARKTSYSPDFSVVHPSGALEFWEAKGAFIRDKAMVKPKIAAELFRGQHKFTLAQKKKTGWVFSEL